MKVLLSSILIAFLFFASPVLAVTTTHYIPGSCNLLAKQGLHSFLKGDPNYTNARDRDNDGIACEKN